MPDSVKSKSTAELYVCAIKKQVVQSFAKYLIDHACTMYDQFHEPENAVGVMDIADLTKDFLEEMV